MNLRDEPLYDVRQYPLRTACDCLGEIATQMPSRVFRILLWTNPKGFSIEKGRYGQQEIEHGYHAREEDFINEFTATGSRWKWERATSVEQLEGYLAAAEFSAIVVLGSAPSYLVRKAVYYCEHVSLGPKTLLIEFERRYWDATDPYTVWYYLHRNGHLHLLGSFVHLVSRKQQLKFLPVAYEHQIGISIPIWDIPVHRVTIRHIEALFDGQFEEGARLDYKRAAAVSDSKHLDDLLYRLCGMANAKGGTFIIGIPERDGFPIGIEDVRTPDKVLNRLAQLLASRFGKDAPEVQPRTLSIRGKTIVVLQVGESVTKRCGLKWQGKQSVVPMRVDRITSWLPLDDAAVEVAS